MSNTDDLRSHIRDLVADYHKAAFAPRPFVPGVSPVPVAGRVFDAEDIQSLMEATLDFWLTAGRFAAQFEKAFAKYFGIRTATLVNSGSSAVVVPASEGSTSTAVGGSAEAGPGLGVTGPVSILPIAIGEFILPKNRHSPQNRPPVRSDCT